jgi:hypothetical protein
MLLYPENIHQVAVLGEAKEHKSLRIPTSRACPLSYPLLSILLVLLVTLGRSSRTSLLVDTHIDSAAQASAIAHML